MKTLCSPAKIPAALAALLVAGSLVGDNVAVSPIGTTQAPSREILGPVPNSTNSVTAAEALAQLQSIPVKGRAPKTGYSRDKFGPAWADVDRNGCDSRNDTLARDLIDETFKPGTNNCVVATGILADKYTGKTINFVRGQDTSSAVQIDHIIPLSDAWQKGAQQLTAEQRTELANDPLNLLATDGPTNIAKGDQDAASWLPSNKASHCDYVARQIAMKEKYNGTAPGFVDSLISELVLVEGC
jgi:hypothetical protein